MLPRASPMVPASPHWLGGTVAGGVAPWACADSASWRRLFVSSIWNPTHALPPTLVDSDVGSTWAPGRGGGGVPQPWLHYQPGQPPPPPGNTYTQSAQVSAPSPPGTTERAAFGRRALGA